MSMCFALHLNLRTFPDWKARELRRAYWASLSYTDSNIGRVLTALDTSPFAQDTVVALWGGKCAGSDFNLAIDRRKQEKCTF
jgi:hypothetical protein